MRKTLYLIAVMAVVFCGCSDNAVKPAGNVSVFENFITVDGDKLFDGDKEFRFVSYNIPCLHYNEDVMDFDNTNPWILPNEFEITDAIGAVRQSGGQVVRIYALSTKKADDKPEYPRHVLGPGVFDENTFRSLDKVLEVANNEGVRVIIPFVDNWSWWGGVAEYAKNRGKEENQFWTDRQLIEDFKTTIDYVVNRTNYYTGVKYKDDKAILGWETGNELSSPIAWVREITEYLQEIDDKHLVLDGKNDNTLRQETIDNPYSDLITTHHYEGRADKMIEHIKTSRKRAKGKKAYYVGEYGFIDTKGIEDVLDTVINENVSGALVWSLRYRNRNGGFYWHSEPFGGNLFKAYHWPGFASGAGYDETNQVMMMQKKAFEIQGKEVPAMEIPIAPVLLKITDPAYISWQGSYGAQSYEVERAEKKDGQWRVVGRNISDAEVQYRPLFNDVRVKIGKNYYYRVKAKNTAGMSVASNVVGPVTAKRHALIDEMADKLRTYDVSDGIKAKDRDTRKAKEDMHRLAGEKGESITYKVRGAIDGFKVFAFFEGEIAAPTFSVSTDGKNYTKINARSENYYEVAGFEADAYGYYKPVLYQNAKMTKKATYLKIEFTDKTEVSRVEVFYK